MLMGRPHAISRLDRLLLPAPPLARDRGSWAKWGAHSSRPFSSFRREGPHSGAGITRGIWCISAATSRTWWPKKTCTTIPTRRITKCGLRTATTHYRKRKTLGMATDVLTDALEYVPSEGFTTLEQLGQIFWRCRTLGHGWYHEYTSGEKDAHQTNDERLAWALHVTFLSAAHHVAWRG